MRRCSPSAAPGSKLDSAAPFTQATLPTTSLLLIDLALLWKRLVPCCWFPWNLIENVENNQVVLIKESGIRKFDVNPVSLTRNQRVQYAYTISQCPESQRRGFSML